MNSKATATAPNRQTLQQRIKAQFPDVYWIAGVGWCGPQWQEATEYDRREQLTRMLTPSYAPFADLPESPKRDKAMNAWRKSAR